MSLSIARKSSKEDFWWDVVSIYSMDNTSAGLAIYSHPRTRPNQQDRGGIYDPGGRHAGPVVPSYSR